ncbi:MAG: hypothetical protein ACM3SY_11425 [Candidatus Omnitrophota bacterium]
MDSAIRLRIEEPKYGQNVFVSSRGVILDLSWFLVVIGILLVMVWGFVAFRDKAYIRFLMSFRRLRTIYFGILVARVLVLSLFLVSLYLMIIIQFSLRGIFLNGMELSGLGLFFSLLLVIWVTFLLISAALGAGSKWIAGAATAFFAWLVFFLIWPEVGNILISAKAENEFKGINYYESQKVKILNEDSLKASEIGQKYKNRSEDEKFAAYRKFVTAKAKFLLAKIDHLDRDIIQKTKRNAEILNFLSIFNPATFLKATGNELSSLGLKNYVALCNSTKEKQNQFFYYIFFKRLDTRDKIIPHVKPFLPPEKCIVPLSIQLPFYFEWGLLMLLAYLIAAFYFSYFRFKRYIKPAFHFKKFEKYPVDVSWIKKNKINGFYTRKEMYLDFFSWMLEKKKITVMMVPRHHHIPDNVRIDSLFSACSVTVPERFRLFADKTFGALKEDLAASILIEIVRSAKPSEYFIIKDFINDLSRDAIDEFTRAITQLKKNSTVIYMSSTLAGVNEEFSDHFAYDPEENIIV